MIAIAGPASRCGMSCPVVDMAPAWVDGEGLHSDVRSVRAHAVRWRTTRARRAHVWAHAEQFLVETPARLGGAQRTVCPVGERFCVVVPRRGRGSRCVRAPPVSAPVMAV